MAANTGGAQNTRGWPIASVPGVIPKITSIMNDFSAEALAELRLWLEQNPPAIGISNILGFSQFTVNPAPFIATTETTTSTTYTDMATIGPTLTGIANGNYIAIFGALAKNSTAGDVSAMSLDINGTTPDDANRATTQTGDFACIVRAVPITLNAGSNLVTCQYRVGTGGTTASFGDRWMFLLKYKNL